LYSTYNLLEELTDTEYYLVIETLGGKTVGKQTSSTVLKTERLNPKNLCEVEVRE
jgi:hypothetical protein